MKKIQKGEGGDQLFRCGGRRFHTVEQSWVSPSAERMGQRSQANNWWAGRFPIFQDRWSRQCRAWNTTLRSWAFLLQPYERHQVQYFENYVSNIMATDGSIRSGIVFFMVIETAWVSEEQLCYLLFSKLTYVIIPFDKRHHSQFLKSVQSS